MNTTNEIRERIHTKMAKHYVPYYPRVSQRLVDEVNAFAQQLHSEQERVEGLTPIMLAGVKEYAWEMVYLARCYHRIQERHCMGDLTKWSETRERNIQGRFNTIADKFGALAVFSGDPRGATVRLWLASGITNDWGKTGYCVPNF